MKLSLWLLGGVELRVRAAHRTQVLDLCLQNGFAYRDFSWHADGSVTFYMPVFSARKLRRLCRTRELETEQIGGYGMPLLLWQLRRRAGLAVGSLAAIILLALSGLFVWDVDVVGNEHMSDAEVISLLRACDFGVGSYLPDVRVRELENRVLMQSDRVAWISVYLDGTVARVQVIESRTEPDEGVPPPGAKPANLIAAADGQIELIELYRGEAVVVRGQAVKKGDLLVSGIYDSATQGYRYTRAAGQVLARTEHTLSVEIPLSYREKEYAEAKTDSLVLNFFDFSLEIFKSTGNRSDTCDIIKEDMGWNGIGERTLPWFVTRTQSKSYVWKDLTRTHDEALRLAYEALERELATLSASAELLSKSITTELGDAGVILRCTVVCIENIAVQSEFEIADAE